MGRRYEKVGNVFVRSTEGALKPGSKAAGENFRRAEKAITGGDLPVFYTCFGNAWKIYSKKNQPESRLTKRHRDTLATTASTVLHVFRGFPLCGRGSLGLRLHLGGNFIGRQVPFLGPSATSVLTLASNATLCWRIGMPKFLFWKVLWYLMQAWIVGTVFPWLGSVVCMFKQFDEHAQIMMNDWVVLTNITRQKDRAELMYKVFAATLGEGDVEEGRVSMPYDELEGGILG